MSWHKATVDWLTGTKNFSPKVTVSKGNKSTLLFDRELTVTNAGFHSFGQTVGRGHQTIFNINAYSDLLFRIESPPDSPVDPGEAKILFFLSSGRTTQGSNPTSDPDLGEAMDLGVIKKGNKIILTSDEYPVLKNLYRGMVVNFGNVPVGGKMRVQVFGGGNIL